MNEQPPWAAEVCALIGADPAGAYVAYDLWFSGSELVGVRAVVDLGRVLAVDVESGAYRASLRKPADVPAAVRALLAGLRATEAALGGVAP